MRPMIPLASLLKRALVRAKVDVVVQAAQVVSAMQSVLDERYGADAGIVVRSLKAGTLSIGVTHAAARAELQLYSGELMEAVNNELGKSIVKRLAFR